MRNRILPASLLLLIFLTLLMSAYRPAKAHSHMTLSEVSPAVLTSKAASPAGVHFKVAGTPYDIPQVRGIYIKEKGLFTIYNSGLPGFPQTTITLSIGADFTGSTGTFKSDVKDKGFIFGFTQGNMKDMIGYAGGKDDPNTGVTAANTPMTITVSSFSVVGTNYIQGNVTTKGTFCGKVYDFKNKKPVDLTDGSFNVEAGH
jgi:hypothetical protein